MSINSSGGSVAYVFVLASVAALGGLLFGYDTAVISGAIGPVVWVVLSEIFPTRVRGTAMSMATVSLWIACYAVSQTFPWLLETFAGNSFFLYALMCTLCFAFVWRFVPVTDGKTLEEIEQQWIR